MTAALRLASYRALARLGVRVDALVVDGPRDLLARPRTGAPGTTSEPRPLPLLPPAPEPSTAPLERPLPLPDLALPDVALPATVVPVIRGDARCVSVAAASVLAKVVRDRRMRAEAEHFPPYAFERNKGYPSATHQCALRGYGLSAIHRRSWAFVDDLPWR
jgi:hypothetical protein